jgi:long-chain fatty acid transport protein
MTGHRQRATIIAAVPFLLGIAAPANASSFYLHEQSIKATGRAFSGEAADQGPESLWWNPASIAGATGISGAFGAAAIIPHADVRDIGTQIIRPGQASAPVGGNGSPPNPAKFGVLPSGAIAVPLNDRIALGLALSSPFSLTTNYPSNSWTRYVADKTKLLTIDIQPSVGVMLTDSIRVGAGINLEYSHAILQKELPNLSPLLADGSQKLKGDAYDVGWSLGAQYVTPRVTLGVSYKSAIKHTYDGTLTISGLQGFLAGSNGTINTKASFTTPWQAIGAIRFKVTDTVTLNLQAIRFGWAKFDRIRLTVPAGAFVPEEYRNTWMVAGGVDWDITPATTLRGGIYRDQTPTQNGRRDPNVPDGDRTGFSLGGSHKLNTKFTIDVAAEYISFDRSSIDRGTIDYAGTPLATTVITNGTSKAHAIVLGVGGRFKL